MTALPHARHDGERWPRVTRRAPCPICQRTHWCRVSPDGAVALCMWVEDGAFKSGRLSTGEPYSLHRLAERVEPPAPIPFRRPAQQAPDVLAMRAVYGLVARHCAADLPDAARDELARRFGPYAERVVEEFGIGYCDPAGGLVEVIDATSPRRDAITAGVLTARGEPVHSLAGRLVIPYRHRGLVADLRGAGLKADGDTKPLSLPGAYAERGVDALFFNHDALDTRPPGGTIHLAGGEWKTIALHLADLPVVGTRGEAELSDGQVAALRAAGVAEVIVHIDAEEPKPGEDLSAGRRLGLPKAERLQAEDFRVRIAEPPREPGGPKVDPDALLRDAGSALVRAYALSAPTLDVYRVLIGQEPSGHGARVAELERENEDLRRAVAERDEQLATAEARTPARLLAMQRDLDGARREVALLTRCLDHPDGAILRGIALEVDGALKRGHRFRPGDGERVYARCYMSGAAEKCKRSRSAVSRKVDQLAEGETVARVTKEEVIRVIGADGQEVERTARIAYLHISGQEDGLEEMLRHLLDAAPADLRGGKRDPRPERLCPHCGEAHGTVVTLKGTEDERCLGCEQQFTPPQPVERVRYRDATGVRMPAPPAVHDARRGEADPPVQDAHLKIVTTGVHDAREESATDEDRPTPSRDPTRCDSCGRERDERGQCPVHNWARASDFLEMGVADD